MKDSIAQCGRRCRRLKSGEQDFYLSLLVNHGFLMRRRRRLASASLYRLATVNVGMPSDRPTSAWLIPAKM